MRRSILKTMISRISTMNPKSPPPAPYCQVLPWLLATRVSSAIAKEKRASCKSMGWNIVPVCYEAYLSFLLVLLCFGIVDGENGN